MKKNLFSGWLTSLRKMQSDFRIACRITIAIIFLAGMIATFDSCSKSDIDDPEYIERPEPEKPSDKDDNNTGDKDDNNTGDKDDDNSGDSEDDNSGDSEDNNSGDKEDDNTGDSEDDNTGDKDDDNSGDKDDDNSGDKDYNDTADYKEGDYYDTKGNKYYCYFPKCTGSLIEIPGIKSLYGFEIDSVATVIVDKDKYNADNTTGTKQIKVVELGGYYCADRLKTVIIPNSVTSIGKSAFNNCSGLTEIKIPNSVTSIGGHAFKFCSSLTEIEIPNSVTSIENEMFSYCDGLTKIVIPNSVTSIGVNVFSGCDRLTEIETPSGTIRSLPNKLEKLVLGASVTKIECRIPESLKEFYCYAKTPPTLTGGLEDSHKFTLYVPKEVVDTYKLYWGAKNITIKAIE